MSYDIAEELAELAKQAPEFNPHPLKNPSNKGLVRSGFQKAMRRGQTEQALRMGELLVDANDSYAWQSMAVVLIEDICLGDVDLISYGTVTTLKTVREEFGGKAGADRLFAAMVKRACEAPKSRTCCELGLGVEKERPHRFEQVKEAYGDNESALINMMNLLDPYEAYVAACVLRKKLRGLGNEILLPSLQNIMENVEDWHEARACMMSFERTVDTMNMALYPIIRKLNAEDDTLEVFDEKPTWPETTIIKSVSSEAFDMHTGIGARALKALWNTSKNDCDWMLEAEKNPPFEGWNPVKAIDSLVFIVEGGLLDQRIVSPFLNEVKRYQDVNFAKGYGVPAHIVDERLDELLEWTVDNIPKLNEMRVWSASK